MSRPAGRPLNTALGWRLPSWLLDYGPIVFVLIEGLAAIRFQARVSGISKPILLLALAATAVALAVRHRWPLPVLAVILAIAVGVDYGPLITIPLLLAVFTVAESADRTTVVVAAVITAVALSVTPWAHGDTLTAGGIISRFVAVGLAVARRPVHPRPRRLRHRPARPRRAARARAGAAGRAGGRPRSGCGSRASCTTSSPTTSSLMVVQAQALAATGAERRAAAPRSARVADLGREALTEMHRMLGVLRLQNGDGSGPSASRSPGVRDLERLIARTREAGLDAQLRGRWADRASCPPASTCPPTGSSRRRSRT